jgi:putative acetyltransferase
MGDSHTPVAIRPESPADHPAIRRLVAAAFGSDVEADLVERIRSSPEYVAEMALVAEADGEIVGHVMVSNAVLRGDAGDRRISMLAPLAVLPDRQKSGIGGALVTAVVAIADERDEPLVVLEGSPAYYGRFGFEHSVRHGIEITLPDWAPPEAAQVRLLRSYDPNDPTLRGRVIYPAAFDGVE